MKKEYLRFILIGTIVLPIAIFLIYKSVNNITKESQDDIVETIDQDIWKLDTNGDFKLSVVISSGYPAIIDVGGSNCYACVKMRGALEELNQEYQGKIIVNFIDITKNYDLSNQFDTYILPTQYFYYPNGKLYKKHVGALTKEEIQKYIEEMKIQL